MENTRPFWWKIVGVGLMILAGLVFALITNIKPGWMQVKEKNQQTHLIENGTYFPTARLLPAFNLQSKQGAFSNAELKQHWSFLFFGFTHCQNICPTTMASLNRVANLLKQEPENNVTQFIFVSIDPKRDTLPIVESYVKQFNPNFIGVTGDEQAIQQLTQKIGIFYQTVTQENNAKVADYDIDHSGSVLLINPEGNIQALFRMPFKPQEMVKDFKKIAAA
ncbi:MAG: SCO family protein [Legionellales bacterium]|nr:SCO family protein [Legionellales bacterium]